MEEVELEREEEDVLLDDTGWSVEVDAVDEMVLDDTELWVAEAAVARVRCKESGLDEAPSATGGWLEEGDSSSGLACCDPKMPELPSRMLLACSRVSSEVDRFRTCEARSSKLL